MDAGAEARDRRREPCAGTESGCGCAQAWHQHRLLYTWRQQLLAGPNAVITRAAPRFAEVELAAASPTAEHGPTPVTVAAPSPRPAGLIEIILPRGALVRIAAEVDARALRRVLSALQEQ